MQAHDGATTPAFRREMAVKVFHTTAGYDTAIGLYLAKAKG